VIVTTKPAPRRRRPGGRHREEGDDYRTISVKLPARLQAIVLPENEFRIKSGGAAKGRNYKKDRLNALTASGLDYTGEFDPVLVEAMLSQRRAPNVTCWQMPGPMARAVVPDEDIPITAEVVAALMRGLAAELGFSALKALLDDPSAARPPFAAQVTLDFALEPQMTGT
jgi:hypothetical protein